MTATSDPAARSLSDVLTDLRFAMVMTDGPGGFEARPLTMAGTARDTLRFIVSDDADWVPSVGAQPVAVLITFSDPKGNTYVSLSGDATVTKDDAVIDRLWNPGAAAFFSGRDDPSIAVLECRIETGHWWDGPSGRIGQALAVVKAAVSDDPDAAGESGVVQPGI